VQEELIMAEQEQTRIDVDTASVAEGVVVVRPIGRLDLRTAAEVRERLVAEVGAGRPRLVVDLGDTSFVDSSGLGALIGGLKAARQAGGDLRLARPGEQARVVLQLTALDRVLIAYDSVAQALDGY
jgi:anti-anti-sigma factor